MDYKIIGQTVPAVEITLNKGESIYTQSGAMTWMTSGISLETDTRGGIMKGLGRVFSGESLFLNTYTATEDNQEIAFGSTVPGGILDLKLTSNQPGLIVQKGSFLCAEPTVELKVAFRKKLGTGLFGGEGFILQDISGSGNVFLEVDGDQIVKELKPGEVIKVDTGNVVAFEKTVSYEIERVKGVKNILFGGEGLFITKLTGPGKIILQTQNFNDFASRIISLMPKSGN